MRLEKINDLYEDFKNALTRLQEALDEDLLKGNIIIDGTIQRFEFTFELSWKLTKSVLSYNGIDAESPRMAIKEAFKAGIIKDDSVKDVEVTYDLLIGTGERKTVIEVEK